MTWVLHRDMEPIARFKNERQALKALDDAVMKDKKGKFTWALFLE